MDIREASTGSPHYSSRAALPRVEISSSQALNPAYPKFRLPVLCPLGIERAAELTTLPGDLEGAQPIGHKKTTYHPESVESKAAKAASLRITLAPSVT